MDQFILSFFPESDKLRISTLYQLLIGKRTSSVLIYGFFFDLLPYLGSLPKLKKEQFEQTMDRLVDQGILARDATDVWRTAKGQQNERLLWTVDFARYGRTDRQVWRLLKFAVQVVSNLHYKEKNYLPTETSPYYTIQVKRWLSRQNRATLDDQLYNELNRLFATLPQKQADLLARQLTGGPETGKLPYQLISSRDPFLIYLEQSASVHHLLARSEQMNVPLITDLISDLLFQNQNRSMLTTRHLILHGMSGQQVMAKRKIKEGTLSDHLIEWALFFDDFPFEQFISDQTIRQLESVDHKNLVYWQYRELNTEGTLDYREFRLYQIRAQKNSEVKP